MRRISILGHIAVFIAVALTVAVLIAGLQALTGDRVDGEAVIVWSITGFVAVLTAIAWIPRLRGLAFGPGSEADDGHGRDHGHQDRDEYVATWRTQHRRADPVRVAEPIGPWPQNPERAEHQSDEDRDHGVVMTLQEPLQNL